MAMFSPILESTLDARYNCPTPYGLLHREKNNEVAKNDAGESIVSPLAKRRPNKADVYAIAGIKIAPPLLNSRSKVYKNPRTK
ncbi:MAG: hypothetical protein QW692_05710 [Nitrososphaerota archaeon]